MQSLSFGFVMIAGASIAVQGGCDSSPDSLRDGGGTWGAG